MLGLGGVGLIVYPTFSDWWNSFHQFRAVASYANAVANMRTEDYDGIFESAEAYNENLTSTGIRWQMTEEERSAYEKELDVTGDGIMGYLEIPAINVMLPIYHGTNENVLQVATGISTARACPSEESVHIRSSSDIPAFRAQHC